MQTLFPLQSHNLLVSLSTSQCRTAHSWMPGSTLLAISHNGAIAEDAVLMFSSALKDQESSMGREAWGDAILFTESFFKLVLN